MSELRHAPGQFCWAELVTTDPEAAREFYRGLMGWTARVDEMKGGGTYTTFFHEGLEAAAAYALSPQMRAAGRGPHWMPYILVEDAAACAARIAESGGVVEAGPRQAGEYGHFAVARDPGGAAFSIWQAGTHFGSRNGHVLGRHCWTELATREVAACKEFYARVFGWDAHVGEMGGVEYVSFLRQGAPVGGLWGMAAGREEDAPEWGVYFSVVNAEAAAEATVAGGGAVVSGPREIAGVGMAAALRDAQGACFHVIALKAR